MMQIAVRTNGCSYLDSGSEIMAGKEFISFKAAPVNPLAKQRENIVSVRMTTKEEEKRIKRH